MNIQKQIQVMRSFSKGKKVEVKSISGDDWVAEDSPSWNWGNLVYRVIPNVDDAAKDYASTYSESLRAAIRRAYKAGYDENTRQNRGNGNGR